jgi:hypothetical protein
VTYHADTDRTGCRLVWSWALGWLVRPPVDPDKRAKQATLVQAIAGGLREVPTVADLHARYDDPDGGRRWLALAKDLYPREWPRLGVHACVGAAYGVRFMELQTGQRLDARHLPGWVGEWAVDG